MTERDDKYHLRGIFYNVYDIDSIGLKSQQCVVEALMDNGVFAYDPKSRVFTPSGYLLHDTNSNMFSAPTIAQIFDPTLYSEPEFADIAPPDYLGESCERLRVLRKDLETQKRTGRSFTLRSLAGYEAALCQPELTKSEAEGIAPALSVKYGITCSAKRCIGFLDGIHDAIDYDTLNRRDDYLEELGRQMRVFWDTIYEFWNTAGREERTSFHAAKLNLMNEITDAAIRKSRSLGLNPDQFTRNDPNHAAYWQKTFGEDVPTPDVLLSRSRIVVDNATKKLHNLK